MAKNLDWTVDLAEQTGDTIGLDWDAVDFTPEDLLQGMNIELEHCARQETKVVECAPEEIARIAWEHLLESTAYYRELAKMEDTFKGAFVRTVAEGPETQFVYTPANPEAIPADAQRALEILEEAGKTQYTKKEFLTALQQATREQFEALPAVEREKVIKKRDTEEEYRWKRDDDFAAKLGVEEDILKLEETDLKRMTWEALKDRGINKPNQKQFNEMRDIIREQLPKEIKEKRKTIKEEAHELLFERGIEKPTPEQLDEAVKLVKSTRKEDKATEKVEKAKESAQTQEDRKKQQEEDFQAKLRADYPELQDKLEPVLQAATAFLDAVMGSAVSRAKNLEKNPDGAKWLKNKADKDNVYAVTTHLIPLDDNYNEALADILGVTVQDVAQQTDAFEAAYDVLNDVLVHKFDYSDLKHFGWLPLVYESEIEQEADNEITGAPTGLSFILSLQKDTLQEIKDNLAKEAPASGKGSARAKSKRQPYNLLSAKTYPFDALGGSGRAILVDVLVPFETRDQYFEDAADFLEVPVASFVQYYMAPRIDAEMPREWQRYLEQLEEDLIDSGEEVKGAAKPVETVDRSAEDKELDDEAALMWEAQVNRKLVRDRLIHKSDELTHKARKQNFADWKEIVYDTAKNWHKVSDSGLPRGLLQLAVVPTAVWEELHDQKAREEQIRQFAIESARDYKKEHNLLAGTRLPAGLIDKKQREATEQLDLTDKEIKLWRDYFVYAFEPSYSTVSAPSKDVSTRSESVVEADEKAEPDDELASTETPAKATPEGKEDEEATKSDVSSGEYAMEPRALPTRRKPKWRPEPEEPEDAGEDDGEDAAELEAERQIQLKRQKELMEDYTARGKEVAVDRSRLSAVKTAVIKECRVEDQEPGKPVCLYDRHGVDLLGRHESEAQAEKQEQAIEISKHAAYFQVNPLRFASALEIDEYYTPEYLKEVYGFYDEVRAEQARNKVMTIWQMRKAKAGVEFTYGPKQVGSEIEFIAVVDNKRSYRGTAQVGDGLVIDTFAPMEQYHDDKVAGDREQIKSVLTNRNASVLIKEANMPSQIKTAAQQKTAELLGLEKAYNDKWTDQITKLIGDDVDLDENQKGSVRTLVFTIFKAVAEALHGLLGQRYNQAVENQVAELAGAISVNALLANFGKSKQVADVSPQAEALAKAVKVKPESIDTAGLMQQAKATAKQAFNAWYGQTFQKEEKKFAATKSAEYSPAAVENQASVAVHKIVGKLGRLSKIIEDLHGYEGKTYGYDATGEQGAADTLEDINYMLTPVVKISNTSFADAHLGQMTAYEQANQKIDIISSEVQLLYASGQPDATVKLEDISAALTRAMIAGDIDFDVPRLAETK